jgi:hypothetical protein
LYCSKYVRWSYYFDVEWNGSKISVIHVMRGDSCDWCVVFQSGMDRVNGEVGSCTGTGVTATVVGKEVTGVEREGVTVVKEEDQEPTTIPVIKMEPDVSCVSVMSTLSVWCARCVSVVSTLCVCDEHVVCTCGEDVVCLW